MSAPAWLERIRAESEPVTLPAEFGAVVLVRWCCRPGQQVAPWDQLAWVRGGSWERPLFVPLPGRVSALMLRPGAALSPGDVLAYVKLERAAETRSERSRTGGRGHPTRAGQKRLSGPLSASESAAPRPLGPTAAARGVEQRVEELSLPPAPPRDRTGRGERSRHRGYYVRPSQERALKRLAAELGAARGAPGRVNESELVRCAIDLLLAQSPPHLHALIVHERRLQRRNRAAG